MSREQGPMLRFRDAANVQLRGLSKSYGADYPAVHALDLSIQRGEFVALLGPSGCGKTTTLMMIAGFTDPTAGDIVIGDRSVVRVPPEQRGIGVVFQNYALFPHLTVDRNISFPLEMHRYSRADIRRRVSEIVNVVGLERHGSRYPHELSGGQQQRVALARALVFEPRLLLMDEPLGALDKHLRERMQHELRSLHKRLGTTVLYVTHDQREALSLADRIAVMNHGKLDQVDTPTQLYMEPKTRFVAGFIGDCNFLPADNVYRGHNCWEVSILGLKGQVSGPGPEDGDTPLVALRPHLIHLNAEAGRGPSGVIKDVVFLGESVEYLVQMSSNELIVRQHLRAHQVMPVGTSVVVNWDWADARLL